MNEPTADEKMFAAIAHASGAAASFVGPLVIWFLKKDQSAFVAYHAIQAGIYHTIAFVAFMVVTTCTFGFGFILLPLFWLPSLFWAYKVYSTGSSDGYPGIAQFGRTEQLPWSFSVASAVVARGDGVYAAEPGPDWTQGPGIYGGLSGAALLRAMALEAGDRPVRSLSLQYCAPLPHGPCEVAVARERSGTGTTFLSARLFQHDRVQVHAIGTFGADRIADLDEDHVRPPDVPPADGLPPFPSDLPGIPTFLRQFDVRFAYGAPPFSGALASRIGAWVRPREPEPLDAPLALGLLDVLPPAILVRECRPRPVTTMALNATFLERLPRADRAPDAFFWVDVHSLVTRAGHSDEEVRLFDAEGRLLALARQLCVVVR